MGWTKVKHRINPSQNKHLMKTSNGMSKDNSNKQNGNYIRQDNKEGKMDTKKQFQSMQHTTTMMITDTDDDHYMTMAEKIKLRGATAVEKAIE
eukprot:7367480-Ditylum_brightwellii.AAC.1